MTEVRKGKAESQSKARSRAAKPAGDSPQVAASLRRAGASAAREIPLKNSPRRTIKETSPSELKRLLAETQDQLSLIHGVLEELCERQEALAAWQMEFSKRLVSLQEAQWRSLEDLAGVDMGSPVEKAFGVQIDDLNPEMMDDQLDEANKMLDEINSQAMPKRAERIRRRRDPLRPSSQIMDPEDTVAGESDLRAQESSPASVFVMPVKVDVH